MADEKLMRKATKRVKERRGFRTHIITYVAINLLLVGVYFFTSRGEHFWPLWTILGWGIGLFFHAFSVYGKLPGKTFEEEVQTEYQRLEGELIKDVK